jgi:hypothetical protein
MSHWLAGLDRGALVPDRALGRVHSVFDRACNVALDDGRLLGLLDRSGASAPLAIRLDVAGGLRARFVPGEPFSIKAGVWRTRGCRGEVAALPVQQPLPPGDLLAPPQIAARLDALDLALASWQAERGATSDVATLATGLAQAVAQREAPALEAAAQGLIGRGVGLTPSGDDLLVGSLAALWRLARGDSTLRPLLASLRASVAVLLHRTTEVSRHYLGLALDDRFVQPLDELRHACLHQARRPACTQPASARWPSAPVRVSTP